MKTLIVEYTPRKEQSKTKKLVEAFKAEIKNSEIEQLSLSTDVPDFFLDENLAAYIQRNYLNLDLTAEQKNSMSKMDRMTRQLKSSDIVVVAYPMFNFSMPAAVKAWFDSVMLKGETWDVKDGKFFGLMQGKKALALISSGGFYGKEPMSSWEHALSLAKAEFQFMGYSTVAGLLAEGMNGESSESNLEKSIKEVQKIARDWYN